MISMRIDVTIWQPPRTLSLRIPEGSDPREVLGRYLELADGETIASVTADAVPDPDVSVYVRAAGEPRAITK